MGHLQWKATLFTAIVTGFTAVSAWDKFSGSVNHHMHSVHATKTHHRAKSIWASNTLVESATPTPTCTHIPPGANDEPTLHEPGTTVTFRKACGITEQTIEECPFLCGSGGDETYKACFNEDVSQYNYTGTEVCQHCLPPCPTLPLSATSTSEPTSVQPSPVSTCTSVSPLATDTPAYKDPGTGLLFRSSCGISSETIAECPYLCSQAGGGAFKECSDEDLSGTEPTGQFPPVECTHCLSPCPKRRGKKQHFGSISAHRR